METKIMQVFYDTNALPYKDSAREVHFPVAGNAFTGASNTTQIRFYVKDIGGVASTTWVAVTKLPSGKKLYEQLSVGDDSGEPYVYLDLSSAYTQESGSIFISLNGYAGGVDIQVDSDTGLYTISGSPVIQATGNIKIAVSYTPFMDSNYGATTTISVQEALALVSEKLNITDGISVVDNIANENPSNYENGQYIYSKAEYNFWHFYKFFNNDFVKITDKGFSENDFTNALLNKLNGIESGAQVNDIEKVQVNGVDLPINDKTVNIDISGKVDKLTTIGLKAYTHNGSTQGEIAINESASASTLPIRDSNSQIYVALEPTENGHATSKYYVDKKIADFQENEISVVDITEYPTLDDFLDSIGEEGFIYLYPIDTTDLTKGYYRYVWENNSWLSLGTTEIDLSDYYTKTETNNTFVAKTFTIASIDMQDNITAQELTDSLVFMNNTTDIDYVMGD